MNNIKIQEDIAEYDSLLDANAPEEVIHQFLAGHSYFFNGIVRSFDSSPLYSKIKLGSEYIMDFCYCDPKSFGPEWYFIEIEKPSYRLFTRKGEQTKELTHSIRQIQDWQEWVGSNKSYALDRFPLIDNPRGIIIIGRRTEILVNDQLRTRLKRINYNFRSTLEIRTFDSLKNNALSLLKLVNENGGSFDFNIPSKALTSKDLKNGLPDNMRSYRYNSLPDSKSRQILKRLSNEEKEFIKNQSFDSFNDDI